MKRLRTAFGWAVILAVIATPVSAQNQRHCAPRDTVVERLAAGYGETRQSVGIGGDNSLVEVYASTESGSWTITVTSPAGLTCLVAAGQSFETLSETLALDGSDA
ncbi:MAG: hypothetical protein JXQ85_10575 [Cognatishimia sp.]|uniref:hypothetical protein n=1 Tax=Cognatishimia sp. TaxID=2211648 RepID=UPI003B8C7A17